MHLTKPKDSSFLTIANWVAVHGNAVVPDQSNTVNIAYTNDGAEVTLVKTTPCMGTFNCALPSSQSGGLRPTHVQVGTESNFTTIDKVTIWCGNTRVDAASPVPGNTLVALDPGTLAGEPFKAGICRSRSLVHYHVIGTSILVV